MRQTLGILVVVFAVGWCQQRIARRRCMSRRMETMRGVADWRRPNADRSDGPLASLPGARDAIRKLKAAATLREPLQVVVADGTYPLSETIFFTPEDSGTPECPIRYRAAEGARPVFTGGRTIAGFKARR